MAKGEKELTSRMIRDIVSLNFNSFEKFKEKNFRAHKVTIYETKENRSSIGTCTCKFFYKNFKCDHLLGTAMRLGNYKIDNVTKQKAKQIFEASAPLPGKARKPGRPKKVTSALQKD